MTYPHKVDNFIENYLKSCHPSLNDVDRKFCKIELLLVISTEKLLKYDYRAAALFYRIALCFMRTMSNKYRMNIEDLLAAEFAYCESLLGCRGKAKRAKTRLEVLCDLYGDEYPCFYYLLALTAKCLKEYNKHTFIK